MQRRNLWGLSMHTIHCWILSLGGNMTLEIAHQIFPTPLAQAKMHRMKNFTDLVKTYMLGNLIFAWRLPSFNEFVVCLPLCLAVDYFVSLSLNYLRVHSEETVSGWHAGIVFRSLVEVNHFANGSIKLLPIIELILLLDRITFCSLTLLYLWYTKKSQYREWKLFY